MRANLTSIDPRKVIYAIIMAFSSFLTSSAHGQFPAAFGGSNPQVGGQYPGGQVPGNQIPGGLAGMMPQPPAQGGGNPFGQALANPTTGVWLAAAQNGEASVQMRLELKPDGEYRLDVNARQGGATNQIQTSGRYQIQGNVLVFDTNGVIERIPMRFDGRHLVIDLPAEGVRVGFARNPQESFVQPLPQQNPYDSYNDGSYGR